MIEQSRESEVNPVRSRMPEASDRRPGRLTSNGMKVALYTRVSTEDQAREGFSLEVQRDYLLQYSKNFGWDVVCTMSGRDVYMDDGFSGGKYGQACFAEAFV
jgi:Resolvase, N terminal domain.